MRIMRSQEQWQSIIKDQQSSGLTIIDYCRQHKLSLTSFYAHRKKLNVTQSGFIRAKVTHKLSLKHANLRILISVLEMQRLPSQIQSQLHILLNYCESLPNENVC
ncbi:MULTISPECIES: transposase [unclassified Pseudoalteromonas]|uniref:IS66 family insertion sequence element accessory protein TnpA n=1 Tax=unclassified Pseudoalteromonas TaxID=194690 RepID=UPI000AAE7927|nr:MULTISPECIES: transposase [unclassified Pseudoalteromonas]